MMLALRSDRADAGNGTHAHDRFGHDDGDA